MNRSLYESLKLFSMARDKMTIHSEWLDAVAALPEDMQGRAMMAIVRYGLTGEMIKEGFISAILAFIRPTIDIDNTRYDNGCKGGRPKGKTGTETKPKHNRNITEQKPKENRNGTETKPNGNYGFIGGTIGGSSTTTTIRENNFNTDDVVVDDLCAHLRAESVWLEAVCMNLHKDLDYIHRRLEEFCTEQKVQGVTAKSLTDAKKHFRSWLRKVEQIEAEQSRRGEPTNNGRPYPIFTYEEMLAECQRKGGTTNDYAPVRVGNTPKPMWVRLADKTKYNIPDKIAS